MTIATLLYGCSENKTESKTETTKAESNKITLNTEQVQELKIQSQKIELDTISTVLSIGGKITTPAQGQVELGYPISAKINTIFIEPGSVVSKGQKLLSLSDLSLVELQQDYLLQKSELENLQQQFSRLTVIKNQNATSEKSYQEAQTALNKAKITVAGMEQKMNLLMVTFPKTPQDIQQNIIVYAPISGKINQVLIKPGQYCQAGQSILSIVNNSELQCELISFQNAPLNLKEGMKVKLKDNNGMSANGTVLRFNNSLQESDHGMHIWLNIQNAPENWIPGITVNGFLSVQEVIALPVPSNGIAYWESKPQIFESYGNGQYLMTEVSIIKEDNGVVYVQFPNMGKNEIVIQNAHYLLMALKNTGE